MPDWQIALSLIAFLSALCGLIEMTQRYGRNQSRVMFSVAAMVWGMIILSEIGSWTNNKVQSWIVAEQAQPEWHEYQKRLITTFRSKIESDYKSPDSCGEYATPADWHIHRERVALYNGLVRQYWQVVIRYAQGSQYQGVEKTLPQELAACPAPKVHRL